MTTSLPTGDGTVSDGPAQSAVDEEAAPTTGLDPDTASDAAGETDTSSATQAAPESDPDTRGGTETPAASDGAASAGAASDGAASDGAEQPEAGTETEVAAPTDRTVLDGPALENLEMHRATDDLQSSEDKIADAREIADDLAAKTQPRAGDL